MITHKRVVQTPYVLLPFNIHTHTHTHSHIHIYINITANTTQCTSENIDLIYASDEESFHQIDSINQRYHHSHYLLTHHPYILITHSIYNQVKLNVIST